MLKPFSLLMYLFNRKAIAYTVFGLMAGYLVAQLLFKPKDLPNPVVIQLVDEVKKNDALLLKHDKELTNHVNTSEQRKVEVAKAIQDTTTDKLNVVVHKLQQQNCSARSVRDSSDLCGGSEFTTQTHPSR